jgi:sarcosine oxidase
VLHWFEPREHPEWFEADRLPVFLCEDTPETAFYGFPRDAVGVKVARHHQGRPIAPDDLPQGVAPTEAERMRPLLREVVPALDGRWIESVACMYTNTPDHHFIIDWHPHHDRVLILSPCSGHGFKFASAIGEIVADMVTGRETTLDLAPFRLARLRS